MSRRVVPQKFVSDGFNTFSSKYMKGFIDNLLINWEFILEHSPWFGGFYECFIGVDKFCVKESGIESPLNIRKIEHCSN